MKNGIRNLVIAAGLVAASSYIVDVAAAENVSSPAWSNPPEGMTSYALVMADPERRQ